MVFKTLIDATMATLAVEKVKSRVFARFGFLYPSARHIRRESIEKDYEVYVVVDGKYIIEYYRKRTYKFTLDEKVQDVVVLNHTLRPELVEDPYRKSLHLEMQEHIVQQSKACFILDAEGREISPQHVPIAILEENPEAVLEEFKKRKQLKIPLTNGIDILRSKILKRPAEIVQVARETFEIVDHAIIYAPVYKAKLINLRTGQEKTIKIDGVTGKLM